MMSKRKIMVLNDHYGDGLHAFKLEKDALRLRIENLGCSCEIVEVWNRCVVPKSFSVGSFLLMCTVKEEPLVVSLL